MGVVGNQSGSVSALADGSAATSVVFPVAFDVLPTGIQLTPVQQSPQTELSAQIVSGSITLTGFSFIVAGGAPASTTTVSWLAVASGTGASTTAYTVIGGPYTINMPNGNGGSNVYTFLPNDFLGKDPTRYAIALSYNIPLH